MNKKTARIAWVHGNPCRAFLVHFFGVLLILFPVSATAHPMLEQARRLIQAEARFDAALIVLEQAEAAQDFARADVIELLTLEALVYYALDQEEGLVRSLRQLAVLDPQLSLDSSVPPAIRTRFDELCGLEGPSLRVSVTATPAEDGFLLRARIIGDDHGLLRGLRIVHRIQGGTWRRALGEVSHVHGDGAMAVEFFGQAIGPGGAVILTDGSESSPHSALAQALSPRHEPDPAPRRRWPVVLVAAATAATVVAVVLAVVLTREEYTDGTQLDPPIIDWP